MKGAATVCPKDQNAGAAACCRAPGAGGILISGEGCLGRARCRAVKESLMFVIPFA